MIAIRHLADLSGAPEHIVRDAIQAGIVRPVWHRRTLYADETTGRRWAESYRLHAPAPKPPPAALRAVAPMPPGPAARMDLPSQLGFRATGGTGAAGEPAPAPAHRPRPPRPPEPPREIRIEPAIGGEPLVTVTQISTKMQIARSVVSRAVNIGEIGVIAAIEPKVETYLVANHEVQNWLRLRAERRERTRQNIIAREPRKARA
jgi:hypothetical protein